MTTNKLLPSCFSFFFKLLDLSLRFLTYGFHTQYQIPSLPWDLYITILHKDPKAPQDICRCSWIWTEFCIWILHICFWEAPLSATLMVTSPWVALWVGWRRNARTIDNRLKTNYFARFFFCSAIEYLAHWHNSEKHRLE